MGRFNSSIIVNNRHDDGCFLVVVVLLYYLWVSPLNADATRWGGRDYYYGYGGGTGWREEEGLSRQNLTVFK